MPGLPALHLVWVEHSLGVGSSPLGYPPLLGTSDFHCIVSMESVSNRICGSQEKTFYMSISYFTLSELRLLDFSLNSRYNACPPDVYIRLSRRTSECLFSNRNIIILGWTHETAIFIGQKWLKISNSVWFNLIKITKMLWKAKWLRDWAENLKIKSSCFEYTSYPHIPHRTTLVKIPKYQKPIFYDSQYTKSSINPIQDVGFPLLSTIFLKKHRYKITHRERTFNKKIFKIFIWEVQNSMH